MSAVSSVSVSTVTALHPEEATMKLTNVHFITENLPTVIYNAIELK